MPSSGPYISATAGVVKATWDPAMLADCDKSLVDLHAYWNAKRRQSSMPSRADVDPIDLKVLLSLLCLIDVVDDERRYVYRLVGTADVAMRGYDPTGKSAKEAYYRESAEGTTCYLDRVVATRQPVLYKGTYRQFPARIETDEVFFLPLSGNGTDVNMIMMLSHTAWLEDEDRLLRSVRRLTPERNPGRSK